MRILVLVLVLGVLAATGCIEADQFEHPFEEAPAEPEAVSLSLVKSRCSYSFDAPVALQVETTFDVRLLAFNSYRVSYELTNEPTYPLAVTHECGAWETLPAKADASVGCYRDTGDAAEQALTTRASSVDAPIAAGMRLRIISRISDDTDADVATAERTIDCAPGE